MLVIIRIFIHVVLIGVSTAFFCVLYKRSYVNHVPEEVQVKGIRGWFLLIMLIAFLVRIIEFGNIPGGLNQDEARTAIDAKAILEYGTDIFGVPNPAWLSSMLKGHQSVMLAWLQIPFIKAFGYSIFSIRLPMLLISLLGLVVIFFYVRDIKGDRIALIVFALTAICPYYIMKSRFALDCDVFAHFVLFGMFFLNKLKKRYIFFSMVFFGLSMYCYGLAFVTIPFLLLFCAFWLYRKKIVNIRDILICMLIYFGVSLPEWATMVINAFDLESITIYGLTCPYCFQDTRGSDLLFMNFSIQQLFKNLWYTFKIVFLQAYDNQINQIRYIGPYYIFSIPFLVWGIYKVIVKCKNEEEENTIKDVMLLLYGAAGLCTGILTPVNVSRIGHIFYPVLIFVGIGIADIVSRVWKYKYYVLGIYLLGAAIFCIRYFGEYKDTYGFYTDFCQAVSDVYNTGKGDGLRYKISTMGGYTFTPESIIMFYHKVNPLQYQGKEDMPDGLSFSEKFSFCFYSLTDAEKENVMPGDLWLVHDNVLEYLDSEYMLDITDYGTWNVITVLEEP